VSTLTAENIVFQVIESSEDVVVVDAKINDEQISRVVDRLALCFVVDEFLFWCEPDKKSLDDELRTVDISAKGSIAVHAKNRSQNHDSRGIIQVVASYFTTNRSVDLENPDIDIRLIICENRWYVGRMISTINRSDFQQRRAHHRPFFSPISLHPKLARALVNLTESKMKDVLLDPFCGTGGILIEAGMLGIQVYGNDVEEKMIEGCSQTLKHFGIKDYRLFTGDVGHLVSLVKDVDAIVTDLPYGKSTTTHGESLDQLYHRAFATFTSIINDTGVIIFGGSKVEIQDIAKKYFAVDTIYPIPMHRSLTRYFFKGHL
jgi:tRNA (guanine10-N2)-dimethyltransferase